MITMDEKEQLKTIIEHANNGHTVTECAEDLGVSERTIARILRKNGYDSTWYTTTKNEAIKRIKADKAIEYMYNNDYDSIADVAKQFNIGKVSLIKELQQRCSQGEIEKIPCKNCNNLHDYSYGQGEFCSQICARSYSRGFVSEEGKERQRQTLQRGKEINQRIEQEIKKIYGKNFLNQSPIEIKINIKDINDKYTMYQNEAENIECIVYNKDSIKKEELDKIKNNNERKRLLGFSTSSNKSYGIVRNTLSPYINKTDEEKEIIRQKISTTLKNKWNEDSDWSREMREYYSELASKRKSSEETKEKLRKEIQRRIENGTHVGWTKRGKNMLSYPEKVWKSFFDSLGLEEDKDYIINYPVNKRKDLGLDNSANYFLDFYMESPNGDKIDIEIDGKQHTYKDRKESDRQRDKALKENNFIVHRIPWININKSEKRKKEVENQKDEVVKLLQKYNIL